jgi:hypothetical protein
MAKKFNIKGLGYIVTVDGRAHAAFDSYLPAHDYAASLNFDRPYSRGEKMDIMVVDTNRFNAVVFSSINGKVVIGRDASAA